MHLGKEDSYVQNPISTSQAKTNHQQKRNRRKMLPRDFAKTVRVSMPFFLPYRKFDVGLAQGWIYNHNAGHSAIDYLRSDSSADKPDYPSFGVCSIGDGEVDDVFWSDSWGNTLDIIHTAPNGDRYRSWYLHLRNGFQHDLENARAMSVTEDEKWEKDEDGNIKKDDDDLPIPTRKWKYYLFAHKETANEKHWGTESQKISVTKGDPVRAGQYIAWSGNTGYGGAGWGLDRNGDPTNPNSANNHLHLFVEMESDEVPPKWIRVDPYGVYNKESTGCYDILEPSAYVRLFAPFFPSFHNIPVEILSRYWGYYTSMGIALQTLSIHRKNNEMLASGSFQSGLSPNWRCRFYMTGDDFQYWFDTYKEQDYRPRDISVTMDASGPRFTVIWTKLQGESFYCYPGLTDTEFDQKWQNLVEVEKMNITSHFVYNYNGIRRHAVIYVGSSSNVINFYLHYDQSEQSFKELFDQYSNEGFNLVSLCANEIPSGSIRWGGIWEKRPWGSWICHTLMSLGFYQQKFDEYSKQGFRLFKIQGYANSSRIAAIWTKSWFSLNPI